MRGGMGGVLLGEGQAWRRGCRVEGVSGTYWGGVSDATKDLKGWAYRTWGICWKILQLLESRATAIPSPCNGLDSVSLFAPGSDDGELPVPAISAKVDPGAFLPCTLTKSTFFGPAKSTPPYPGPSTTHAVAIADTVSPIFEIGKSSSSDRFTVSISTTHVPMTQRWGTRKPLPGWWEKCIGA